MAAGARKVSVRELSWVWGGICLIVAGVVLSSAALVSYVDRTFLCFSTMPGYLSGTSVPVSPVQCTDIYLPVLSTGLAALIAGVIALRVGRARSIRGIPGKS